MKTMAAMKHQPEPSPNPDPTPNPEPSPNPDPTPDSDPTPNSDLEGCEQDDDDEDCGCE